MIKVQLPDNHNHTTQRFRRQADERGWLDVTPTRRSLLAWLKFQFS